MSALILFMLIVSVVVTVLLLGTFCWGICHLLHEACCIPNNPPNRE